jgi:hypothetical protein
MCTMCHERPGAWLVWNCKHMGPCLECCPRPADLPAGAKFLDPPEYPTCKQCQGKCTELFRVMM